MKDNGLLHVTKTDDVWSRSLKHGSGKCKHFNSRISNICNFTCFWFAVSASPIRSYAPLRCFYCRKSYWSMTMTTFCFTLACLKILIWSNRISKNELTPKHSDKSLPLFWWDFEIMACDLAGESERKVNTFDKFNNKHMLTTVFLQHKCTNTFISNICNLKCSWLVRNTLVISFVWTNVFYLSSLPSPVSP